MGRCLRLGKFVGSGIAIHLNQASVLLWISLWDLAGEPGRAERIKNSRDKWRKGQGGGRERENKYELTSLELDPTMLDLPLDFTVEPIPFLFPCIR